MHKGGPHTANYRADIDGLRAVAVLAVVGYHFFPGRVPSGFVGVDIFFVISGFLISGIILNDLAENRFSFLKFYARRVRRLFPALLVVLGFTLLIGWLILFPEEYKALGKHAAGGAGFISNILYWRESGYFDAEAAAKPLLHLWSLGIEEQFYIFFPLLLCLLWKKGFREGLFITLLLAASLVYNFHLERQDQVADFYSPLARFWELLIGAVLACLSRGAPDSRPRRAASKVNAFMLWLIYKDPDQTRGRAPLSHLLSALGFMLIAYSLLFFRNLPVWPGHWAIIPAMGAALILAAGPDSIFNRRLLGNRLAVAVGLVSYPLYLWHWPIISYLRIVSGDMPDRQTRVWGALIALLLAGLTYILVERPFRFGSRFKALKTLILGVLMTVAASAGVFIYTHDGLPGRPLKSPEHEETANLDAAACQAYIGMPAKPEFPSGNYINYHVCRVSVGHGASTVALIGDSHAWSAYFGAEKLNSALGFNTLMIGRHVGAGGPILLDAAIPPELFENNDIIKDYNQKFLRQTFDVLKKPEIKAVFIFIARHGGAVPLRANIQLTIDELNRAGKKVFLVVDWPFIPKPGVDYVDRPYVELFRSDAAKLYQGLERNALQDMLFYYSWPEYFQVVRSMKNVTLIDGTWDAFCPDNECRVFSETGRLLYVDYHHLTNAGSEFLAEKVLAPYLKELAAD